MKGPFLNQTLAKFKNKFWRVIYQTKRSQLLKFDIQESFTKQRSEKTLNIDLEGLFTKQNARQFVKSIFKGHLLNKTLVKFRFLFGRIY